MDRVSGTTVLTGDVVDRAMLHGFIQRIEELGVDLLLITQVEDTGTAGAEGKRE